MNDELTQKKLEQFLMPDYITTEQKNAIVADGGSLLLSASAGSGKTFVLSSRVVYKIASREHELRADRLLVVTFTRAAAKEMRKRITAKLNELVSAFPNDARLQQQQLLLSRAKITTIDSFCSDLLRDHFDKLDLSPNFRIADETELGQVKDQAIDELFEQYYADEDTDFQNLCDYFSLKDDQKLKSAVLQLYQRIRSNPFPLHYLKESFERYINVTDIDTTDWSHEIRIHVGHALDYSIELFKRGFAYTQDDPVVYDHLEQYHNTAISALESLSEQLQQVGWDDARRLLAVFKFPRKPTKKPEGYDKEFADGEDELYLKTARSVVNGLSKEYLLCSEQEFLRDIAQQRPIFDKLFEVTERFYQKADEFKREKNILDFPDLGILSIQLLLDSDDKHCSTPLCETVRDGIDEIFVDEFQDVNELQDMLFRAISRDQTNLFMVGDIKQSIYRFRQANPEIFLQKRNEFFDFSTGQFPSKIILAENFRSRKEVTGSVNYLFRQLMTEQLGELEYNESEQLQAGATYPTNHQAMSELHLIDISEDESDDSRIALEGNYIGRTILKMYREGYSITSENGDQRRCQLGDFVILLRSKKDKADVYAKQLLELGIDVWTENASGYFGSREVSLMLNLLRIIDNPLQDIPLMSVMVSPLFGFEADEMAQLRIVDRKAPLYVCVQQGIEQNEKCKSFVTDLATLRNAAAIMSVEKLIQKIYDETLFYSLFGAMESSEQKLANLRLLLSYANKYETGNGRGLSGFIRYIDAAQEANRDFECANIFTENSDSVRIMTIHKSKGLEFPICLIANCAGQFNFRDLQANMALSSKMGFTMKMAVPELLKQYPTIPHVAVQLEGKSALLSEEMRVLYVAMTRAKEKLIFTLATKNPQQLVAKAAAQLGVGEKLPFYPLYRSKTYGEWLLMGLMRHADMDELRKLANTETPLLKFSSEHAECSLKLVIGNTVDEWAEQEQVDVTQAQPDAQTAAQLIENLNFKYPYQTLCDIPAKLSVTQITKQRSRVSISRRPIFQQRKGLTATERGTATHQFIQFADFKSAEENLDVEIQRLCNAGFLDQMQANGINRNGLRALFGSSLAQRIQKADQIHRELSFLYELDAGEVFSETDTHGKKILIQGIADCVIEEGNALTIIDYKTDHATEAQLVERYKPQLMLYKRAISELFGKNVEQCMIYSVSLSREIYL